MQRLLTITAYFVIVCVAGCLLAYPIYLFTGADFERVVSRTILILAVLLFYPSCRYLNINSLASLGWQRSQMISVFIRTWLLGMAMLLPISAVYYGCGFRIAEPEPITFVIIIGSLLSAALSGIVIGIIEESVFRGMLQSQLRQSMRAITAIVVVSIIYSSVHFLQATEQLSHADIKWYSGFSLLASALANFMHIGDFIDAWVGLFLAGIFLSLVRMRSGNLVACIGIHAGWVTHIKLFKGFTDRDSSAGCAPLASQYDNYVGELSTAWLMVLLLVWGIVVWRQRSTR